MRWRRDGLTNFAWLIFRSYFYIKHAWVLLKFIVSFWEFGPWSLFQYLQIQRHRLCPWDWSTRYCTYRFLYRLIPPYLLMISPHPYLLLVNYLLWWYLLISPFFLISFFDLISLFVISFLYRLISFISLSPFSPYTALYPYRLIPPYLLLSPLISFISFISIPPYLLLEIEPIHLSVEGLRPWDWSYPVLQYFREWPTLCHGYCR